jgi:DNA-binding transcriptional ArsR family regulator
MGDAASAELQVLKARFFQALAHPIRIRMLEILVTREAKVQDLQRALGIDQPIVSQQLARLRASGIVVSRKQGTATVYAAADPLLADLLRVARTLLNRRLTGVRSLLRELESESASRRPR